jgi:glycosyltransferase involved in cell wall biosynthesis
MVKISIIIKTLNEESNICQAISSSIKALHPFGGEIIVADSASADKTVERASQFPITVVQIAHSEERRCGIGPQLGYQYSTGEYVYILDGDMELDAGFLRRAVELLDHHSSIAGVGGIVADMRIANLEAERRAKSVGQGAMAQPTEVDHLWGGGLYRRSAIEQVSYFSDRNLHGFEEYDLGARLRTKGWLLVRLEERAVNHYGYLIGTRRLLWKRVRDGRFLSAGEIVRAALDNHYFGRLVMELRAMRFPLGVWMYWLLLSSLVPPLWGTGWVKSFLLISALLPPAVMTIRHQSLRQGLYSVVSWHLLAIGLVLGAIRPRKRPAEPIESLILRNAPALQPTSS